MNVSELKKNLHDVIERYRNKAEFTGEVCRDVMARDCLQVVEELEAENERLKAEIKVLHTECDTCWKVEELRKENEKLKCLVLHAMRDLFCVYMANEYWNLQDRKDEEGKARAKKLYEKFAHLRDKYREAYRKAKAELKEGK